MVFFEEIGGTPADHRIQGHEFAFTGAHLNRPCRRLVDLPQPGQILAIPLGHGSCLSYGE